MTYNPISVSELNRYIKEKFENRIWNKRYYKASNCNSNDNDSYNILL